MQVMTLIGSVRPGSFCRATATAVSEILALQGADSGIWDPAETPLPLADPAYHADPTAHPYEIVRGLATQAQDTDAFVLISPVYHNSYSATLKNCLDHLAIAQFRHKPVTLIAHGSGLGAVQACDHLRIVVRGLYGLALPQQLITVPGDFLESATGLPELVNPPTIRRLESALRDLLFYARVGQTRLTGSP